mmetsp:Transcript_11631/g.48924  ORF Transcript_11631/g.48924 Transcript_11631/m.48924 type:complete len:275 (+) Transcript_11631:684-1508(+)
MVGEDRGRARVRQDVGVALRNAMRREGPVIERAARVVVVDEGDRPARPEAQHTRRPPRGIDEAPVLTAADRLLEDGLGGEVEGSAATAGRVDPIDGALPVRVLVVVEHALRVRARVPELAHDHLGRRVGVGDVLARVFARVALDIVEAPSLVADVTPEIVEPFRDVPPHGIVRVVEVRRGGEVLLLLRPASATEHAGVGSDGPRAPVHPAMVLVPASLAVLPLRAPVIHDDVRQRNDALVTHCVQAIAQALLATVLRVEVPQVPWEVPLIGHGL